MYTNPLLCDVTVYKGQKTYCQLQIQASVETARIVLYYFHSTLNANIKEHNGSCGVTRVHRRKCVIPFIGNVSPSFVIVIPPPHESSAPTMHTHLFVTSNGNQLFLAQVRGHVRCLMSTSHAQDRSCFVKERRRDQEIIGRTPFTMPGVSLTTLDIKTADEMAFICFVTNIGLFVLTETTI